MSPFSRTILRPFYCTTAPVQHLHPPPHTCTQALHDLGLRALQLNLDLNSFNERKIKLPDVAALATWPELTRLTLQVRSTCTTGQERRWGPGLGILCGSTAIMWVPRAEYNTTIV